MIFGLINTFEKKKKKKKKEEEEVSIGNTQISILLLCFLYLLVELMITMNE